MTVQVPFAAFDQRFADWADALVDSVAEVAAADEFILKSRVASLESAIAERAGVRHAIACANGTGALTLILTALGVGPGDEVVTPAFSFISSASAIALAGARPVFADVTPDSMALAPEAAAGALTSRTKALLPAHLFCYTAPMAALRDLAEREGLHLVEDSAVTLGGTVDGRATGSWGAAGVFSFFPAKPLGGCGDAGMVVTDDDALAAACRALRNHGQVERFRHDLLGFNCRMDEVIAAFLLRRLADFDQQTAARRALAERYSSRLRALGPAVVVPPDGHTGRAVYTYVVRAAERDALRDFLARRGIETVASYPTPLHLQPVFAHLGHGPGDFPHAERLARECLALPLYPELPLEVADRVADAVADFAGAGA
ncbi:DegT/DnrJ/EryC1/StrS family aminotransferase [Streptomyces sp. NPDC059063]|uniref:DegT/DnrJ/EryC1/StrS family aminotransferase n=1 Tax=unclassified Streptomyces TaxID=2593676 RepID=UPI0036BB5E8D